MAGSSRRFRHRVLCCFIDGRLEVLWLAACQIGLTNCAFMLDRFGTAQQRWAGAVPNISCLPSACVRQSQYGARWTERSGDRQVSASSLLCVLQRESIQPIYSPVLTICTARFNITKFYVQPTQCVYVFCVDLRTNSDYFPIQH